MEWERRCRIMQGINRVNGVGKRNKAIAARRMAVLLVALRDHP